MSQDEPDNEFGHYRSGDATPDAKGAAMLTRYTQIMKGRQGDYMAVSPTGEWMKAADVNVVLAEKDANVTAYFDKHHRNLEALEQKLAEQERIMEEQRLREFKLVESLQATKRELARVTAQITSYESHKVVGSKHIIEENALLRHERERAEAQMNERGNNGT